MLASEALEITRTARSRVDAWQRLFENIEKKAKAGETSYVFDEETERAWFDEPRREVKRKLEGMGYSVEYRRLPNLNSDWGSSYHNEYTIDWWKVNPLEVKRIDELNSEKAEMLYEAIQALDALKKAYPETSITIEASNSSIKLNIAKALIYKGFGDELIIDAE